MFRKDMDIDPDRVYYAQVPLVGRDLLALLKKAGTIYKSRALQIAVEHYINCPHVGAEDEHGVKGVPADKKASANND